MTFMRLLLKGLGTILLLLIIGAMVFAMLMWFRAPGIVSSKLSRQLRTAVEVGDIRLSFASLSVDRFEIYNPPGFDNQKALSVDEITIHAPPNRLFHDMIVIDEIAAKGIFIGMEFDSPRSTKGNWSTLLATAEASQKENAKERSDRSVFIKRIVLRDIQAYLYYQSDGKIRKLKPIKEIVLHNISSKGGNLEDQLMNSALGESVKQIFVQENLKEVLDQLLQSPIKDALGPLKGIFGAAE